MVSHVPVALLQVPAIWHGPVGAHSTGAPVHAPLTQAMVGQAVHVVGFGNNNGQAGTGSGLKREIFTKNVTGLWPTWKDIKQAFPAVCRGTALGSMLVRVRRPRDD